MVGIVKNIRSLVTCWPNRCTAKSRFSFFYLTVNFLTPAPKLGLYCHYRHDYRHQPRQRDEATLIGDAFFLQYTRWFLMKSVWSKIRKKNLHFKRTSVHVRALIARGHPRTQDHLPPSATPSEIRLPPFSQRAGSPGWSLGVQNLSPLHHSVSVPHSSHFIWGSRVQTAPWERCRYRVGRQGGFGEVCRPQKKK